MKYKLFRWLKDYSGYRCNVLNAIVEVSPDSGQFSLESEFLEKFRFESNVVSLRSGLGEPAGVRGVMFQ